MYARMIQFTMGPGTKETADALRGQIANALKKSEGLVKVYFTGDYETGTYGSIAIWDSKEAGESAFQKINPQLKEALTGLIQEPPRVEYFEIFEVVEP